MSRFTEQFDVVVVGAGHAGCEAAMACARMGLKSALFTLNVDLIAQMSCNPAVGGIAKGHLVREVDALGGIMGEVTDAVGIQFRLLNTSRGPAVWTDGWPARSVQETKLNADSIGDFAHDATEGVDLAHQVAFGDTTHCGVARHLRDQINVEGEKRAL